MVLFRIIFYILLGYLIFQVIRLVMVGKKAYKKAEQQNFGSAKREKDISKVAKIVDEKRFDDKKKDKSKD